MAVNLMLRNNGGGDVVVDLIDSYGGNFSAEIMAGMSQNHALMEDSEVMLNGESVHHVSLDDEGQEIVIAE